MLGYRIMILIMMIMSTSTTSQEEEDSYPLCPTMKYYIRPKMMPADGRYGFHMDDGTIASPLVQKVEAVRCMEAGGRVRVQGGEHHGQAQDHVQADLHQDKADACGGTHSQEYILSA